MSIYEAIETVLKNSRNMISTLYLKAKYSFKVISCDLLF